MTNKLAGVTSASQRGSEGTHQRSCGVPSTLIVLLIDLVIPPRERAALADSCFSTPRRRSTLTNRSRPIRPSRPSPPVPHRATRWVDQVARHDQSQGQPHGQSRGQSRASRMDWRMDWHWAFLLDRKCEPRPSWASVMALSCYAIELGAALGSRCTVHTRRSAGGPRSPSMAGNDVSTKVARTGLLFPTTPR